MSRLFKYISPGYTFVNGTYFFKAKCSVKTIDTFNRKKGNGTNMVQWKYWGGDPQRYQVTYPEGGWHRISPVVSLKQVPDVFVVSKGKCIIQFKPETGQKKSSFVKH